MMDLTGHPEPIPEEVRDFLKAQGIRRLLLGHQPLGDTPTVVKSPHLEVRHHTAHGSYTSFLAVLWSCDRDFDRVGVWECSVHS